MAEARLNTRLGEFVTLQRGFDLPASQRCRGGVPILGSFGVTGQHSEAMVSGPGVTIGRSGASIGVATFSKDDFWPLNTTLFVKDFHGNDERFAYYFLMSMDFRRFNSGSAQPSLNRNYIHPIPIEVPPIASQHAIARILGALDDKIELNRETNRTLEELAQAIFKSWFVDFDPVVAKADGRRPFGMSGETAALFPDSFVESEMGPIPDTWRVSKVGSEFRILMGQSPPGHTYNEAAEGMPFYQGRRDFSTRFPGWRVYCTAPTRIAEQNQALVSVRAPVGDLNMAWEQCAIGRGVAAVEHVHGLRSFCYYSMWALQPEFAVFEGDGSVFGSMSGNKFRGVAVIAPPRSVTAAFERLVGLLDSLFESNHAESRTLAALRDTLLPKLLSGEIRVKTAEKEVEKVL